MDFNKYPAEHWIAPRTAITIESHAGHTHRCANPQRRMTSGPERYF
ncbi:MAG: hypothetical protein K0U70_00865 [Actinomycetia bacterium]|nr:hypothetical protein [Actinomycetes bacterium]MCH9766328.1 hypothetical protein [Actinomycetes bacterium]